MFRFLKVLKSPTNQILEILTDNIIGTPGHGMLYKHQGVTNKIFKIQNPYYVNLIRNNLIVGTCCFCKRVTANSGKQFRSFYIRYFSFKDLYRRKSINNRSIARHSILREEVKEVLSGQSLEIDSNETFFYYAYVDPRNLRSVMLCDEFEFEPIRQYATIIFNRIKPKDAGKESIDQVSKFEETEVKKVLVEFYKDFNMFSFDNLLNGSKYYIIRNQNGKIVAGAQANPDAWKILSLPGKTGQLILNTFTYLPYLNRLFNKEYRFLTLEGIYYTPGYEQCLEVLFENMLVKYGLNSAIMVIDADTQLYKTLRSLNLGMVDKLNKEVRGNVICKFVNITEENKQMFKTNPAYISGIDVT